MREHQWAVALHGFDKAEKQSLQKTHPNLTFVNLPTKLVPPTQPTVIVSATDGQHPLPTGCQHEVVIAN